MTKGPCAMRGLLHGPLVSNRSAWPAGNPREVLRDSPTEVLLDGRRASAYASVDLDSTRCAMRPTEIETVPTLAAVSGCGRRSIHSSRTCPLLRRRAMSDLR
jgi:hypothetical protein